MSLSLILFQSVSHNHLKVVKRERFINESKSKQQTMTDKQEVPQINPETGISVDYINEFTSLSLSIQYKSKDKFLSDVKNIIPRKYTEIFNEDEYENVITEENEEKITQLDEIVDEFNKTFSSEESIDNYSASKYIDFAEQISDLIKKEFEKEQTEKKPEKREELNMGDFVFEKYRIVLAYFVNQTSDILGGVNLKIRSFFHKV